LNALLEILTVYLEIIAYARGILGHSLVAGARMPFHTLDP